MHHRNTLVHARVYSIHNKNSGFLKYLDSESEKIRKYEGGKDQFWEINRERIIGNLDDYLSPLRELFFERNSSYYGIMSIMTKPDFFKKLTSIDHIGSALLTTPYKINCLLFAYLRKSSRIFFVSNYLLTLLLNQRN